MSNKMHPSAAHVINSDGERLVGLLKVQPLDLGSQGGFESRKPVSGKINAEDMVGEPILGDSNAFGDSQSKYFIEAGNRVTLAGDDYAQLRRFIDKVLRTKPFSEGVSNEFLETESFKWIRARYRDASTGSLSEFLLHRYEQEVRSHKVLVPITAIELQRTFRFGDVSSGQ